MLSRDKNYTVPTMLVNERQRNAIKSDYPTAECKRCMTAIIAILYSTINDGCHGQASICSYCPYFVNSKF